MLFWMKQIWNILYLIWEVFYKAVVLLISPHKRRDQAGVKAGNTINTMLQEFRISLPATYSIPMQWGKTHVYSEIWLFWLKILATSLCLAFDVNRMPCGCRADPIWNTEKLDFVRARANCYSKCRQWKMCKLSMKNLFRALRTQYWSYEPLNKIWPRCLFSLANYRYCMVFEHNFTIFIEQWTCVPCKDNIVV